MTDSDWAGIKHFTAAEFASPDKMSVKLLSMLDRVRDKAGVPLCITSSYRDGDPASHGDGDAVDISDNMCGEPISSTWRFLVMQAAIDAGFVRIGDYIKHLHVDVSKRLAQDVLWLGEDRHAV